MSSQGSVVVWEWLFYTSHWLPYEPDVSNYIETAHSQWVARGLTTAWPNQYSVQLSNVSASHAQFVVDLNTMSQTSQSSGASLPVRRQEYPADSAPAVGVSWQWAGDTGQYHSYSVEVSSLLEKAHLCKASAVDFNRHPFYLPYIVRLSDMLQVRHGTNYKRHIQRVLLSQPYMPTSTSFSHVSSSQHPSQVFHNSTTGHASSSGLPSTSSVDSNSFMFPSLFPSRNLTLGFPQHLSSLSVPAVGSSWAINGGLQGDSSTVVSPFMSGPNSQRQLFTIGRSIPYHSSSRRKRAVVRNLTTDGQSQVPVSQPQSVTASHNSSHSLVVPRPSHNGVMSGVHSSLSDPLLHRLNLSSVSQSGKSVMPPSSSMTSKRKRHDQLFPMPANMFLPSSAAAATVTSGLPVGFPAGGFFSGFPTTVVPAGSHNNHQLDRLQVPISAIVVVHQEDVRDIAGIPTKQVLKDFVQLVLEPPATEDCCICCDSLKEASGYGGSDEHVVVQLYKCSHMFHLDCIAAMYDSGNKDGGLQCPTCKSIYGVKRGDCPDGRMSYHVIDTQLPGYEGYGAIEIVYYIASGCQNSRQYTCRGFPRYAYLPNSEQGRRVLGLLAEAWRRRLTFTIGTSVTTGESNSVVWNEIHHKTSITNDRGHGYPDPNYLDNVIAELAAQGVEDN